MGVSKLLLPWPTKSSPDGRIIDQVLAAWTRSAVKETVVVVRAGDDDLLRACKQWPVSIVQPHEPPEDMKASIMAGIGFLHSNRLRSQDDRLFLAPSDLPTLSPDIINRMIDSPNDGSHIVVADYGGHQSHPILLPNGIADEIYELGEDEGINVIVDRHPKIHVSFSATDRPGDIDTPAEYQRALADRST